MNGRLAAGALALIAATGCANHVFGDCSNGTCVCGENQDCSFTCDAPPCHVDCEPGSTCSGACANGECTCEQGASCSFSCGAPPCNLTCGGQNAQCDGTCADGSCTCAAGSACQFACASGPCHTTCSAGATCVVTCPNTGVTGTQDCNIVSCAAGAPVACTDGVTLACGAPCPSH